MKTFKTIKQSNNLKSWRIQSTNQTIKRQGGYNRSIKPLKYFLSSSHLAPPPPHHCPRLSDQHQMMTARGQNPHHSSQARLRAQQALLRWK